MQECVLKNEEQDFEVREAYRTLRSNIEFSGNQVKVIGITSSTPNEGKSTISFELAKAFAAGGKKVMFIDADLRKSMFSGKVERGNVRYGLTHFLSGQAKLSQIITQTDIEHLYMIFAGPEPPNPAELLGGELFANMVDGLKNSIDIIIIDTPPLGAVIDAAVISKNCDGMVLVIESGATGRKLVMQSKDQLEKAGAKIFGTVLNKVSGSGRRYYKKEYGYGGYSKETLKFGAHKGKKS